MRRWCGSGLRLTATGNTGTTGKRTDRLEPARSPLAGTGWEGRALHRRSCQPFSPPAVGTALTGGTHPVGACAVLSKFCQP